MTAKKDATSVDQQKNETPECFVVMPISDQPGYDQGHFTAVYRDLIKPAIIAAGYRPIRADEVKSANIIHMDIINRLIEAPLVVCDLSGLNPNVLYELGIRQSFGLPVVLIKDEKTRDIFDIAPIRFQPYQSSRLYDTTIAFHGVLKTAITDTTENEKEAKSFIELLAIKQAAALPKMSNDNIESLKTDLILRQLTEISNELKATSRYTDLPIVSGPTRGVNRNMLKRDRDQVLAKIKSRLEILPVADMGPSAAHKAYSSLHSELEALTKYCDSQSEFDELSILMSRLQSKILDLTNQMTE